MSRGSHDQPTQQRTQTESQSPRDHAQGIGGRQEFDGNQSGNDGLPRGIPHGEESGLHSDDEVKHQHGSDRQQRLREKGEGAGPQTERRDESDHASIVCVRQGPAVQTHDDDGNQLE